MEVRVNFTYSRFIPLARAAGSYYVGDFGGRRTGLDFLGGKGKFSAITRNRMEIVGLPASNVVTILTELSRLCCETASVSQGNS
jgi:hypothetical protein